MNNGLSTLELIEELHEIEGEIDSIEASFYTHYDASQDARLETLLLRLESVEQRLRLNLNRLDARN